MDPGLSLLFSLFLLCPGIEGSIENRSVDSFFELYDEVNFFTHEKSVIVSNFILHDIDGPVKGTLIVAIHPTTNAYHLTFETTDERFHSQLKKYLGEGYDNSGINFGAEQSDSLKVETSSVRGPFSFEENVRITVRKENEKYRLGFRIRRNSP